MCELIAQLMLRNRKVIDSFGVFVAYFLSVYPVSLFVLKETFKRSKALIFSDQNNNHTDQRVDYNDFDFGAYDVKSAYHHEINLKSFQLI